MSNPLPDRAPLGILLVDENRIFADVLAMRLREEPQVEAVAVAGSATDAVAILEEFRPDVIIVDYGVRGDPARRLLAELSAYSGNHPVLVLSTLQDTRTIVAALESGVRGWVNTDSSFATLWAAVREVLAGRMVLSPSVVEPVVDRLLEALRHEEPSSLRRDFIPHLSPRELEVLRCLVAGMNKKEIAARLFLSINTVRTHVQHLLRHADEHTTLALVAAARDLGITGIDDPP
jgi:DNA-binding NarL/FixJ family response regulator